jgi:hypothetical protein
MTPKAKEKIHTLSRIRLHRRPRPIAQHTKEQLDMRLLRNPQRIPPLLIQQ